MRWPIRFQLLLPMITVGLLAGFLATGITAYWIALRVRGEQRENLDRVEKTLVESAFPLTGPVLTQMRGLSGAEFVLFSSDNNQLKETTLPVDRPMEILSCKDPNISVNGRKYLIDSVTIPSRSNPSQSAIVFILYPEDKLTSSIHQAIYPALIAGLIAVVVAAAVAGWLARRFAIPIHTLVDQTAVIARGNFNPMAVPQRNDELCDLIKSINSMTAQLADSERQVRQNERLKTLGQLGAAMAHQLRNAATGGSMAIELHRRDCPIGATDESLDVALRQLRLMESYLRQFLSIQRPAATIKLRVDAGELVADVIRLHRPSFIHAGIELQFTPCTEAHYINGDPESLRQLATNLIVNALEAALTGNHKPPRVSVDVGSSSDGVGLLRVEDSGPGPADAVRNELFNSFITTKPNGVGLGLFVARQIAENHHGRLIWNRKNDMTSFIFEFPLDTENHHGPHINS